MVSHTGTEKPAEVLKRIPWLMQTGVEELHVVQGAWSAKWLDSLRQKLAATTALKIISVE